MQCSVDVTESLVKLLRVWCRCAVIPLVGLKRRSAGRWRPWAIGHVMQPIIKTLFTNRFSKLLLQNFSNKQAIIILKNIYIMFN